MDKCSHCLKNGKPQYKWAAWRASLLPLEDIIPILSRVDFWQHLAPHPWALPRKRRYLPSSLLVQSSDTGTPSQGSPGWPFSPFKWFTQKSHQSKSKFSFTSPNQWSWPAQWSSLSTLIIISFQELYHLSLSLGLAQGNPSPLWKVCWLESQKDWN